MQRIHENIIFPPNKKIGIHEFKRFTVSEFEIKQFYFTGTDNVLPVLLIEHRILI
jgi:hypothetical protein